MRPPLRSAASAVWLALAACGPDAAAPTPTGDDCTTDLEQFTTEISPILQSDCAACHVEGGLAGDTRHVLVPTSNPDHLALNFAAITALATEQVDGESLLVAKITGAVPHGGGARFSATDPVVTTFREFAARAANPGGCEAPAVAPTCLPGVPTPGEQPLRRLTDSQFANAAEDLFGVRPAPGLFPATVRDNLYATWPEANVVSAAGAEGMLYAAEDVAAAVAADIPGRTGCAETDLLCLDTWATTVARRAWRGPVTAEDAALVGLVWQSTDEPSEKVERLVSFLLQSPRFLYLDGAAVPVDSAPDVMRLTDHALAARLSFFLLDTTPSDDLLALADQGGLDTRAEVLALAAEMVEDPRALPVIAKFHHDWLHTYQLETIAKDALAYPQFTPELVDEMNQEVDLFVTEVVWLGDGTFDALLTSPVTWTTPALDNLYGTTTARSTDGWERRTTDRPGVLTRAAFLTAHAYSATSAPVRRGAFVLDQLLCEVLVPPPGIALELEAATETNTIRDRLAAHAADPSCAPCHDLIDPIGFAFENYGALGEWRDTWENGIPVDATGTLAEPPGTFDGVPELLAVLDQTDHVRNCYAAEWLSYGVGRAPTVQDACALDDLQQRFAATGGDLRDLLVQIAASDSFRYRPTTEAQ